MAGMVDLPGRGYWTGPSWLFDWMVSGIAELVEWGELTNRLREIVELNLGLLDLGDFEDRAAQEILDILASRMLPVAEERLILRSGFDREDAIGQVRNLAALASDAARPS
ncbi:hypothetical protein ACIQVL_49435 [Streptomyces sp. NPDC090499]|uniref:hypothetical protein n=1 Tax=Streptomyces sp. NPDC090499 TaxID=3365965 RepID=UPI00382D5FC9